MSITRTALPLLLVSTLLTGCAGLQKSDWPTCALVGGCRGRRSGLHRERHLGRLGRLIGGVLGASYCWVHGAGEQVAAAPPPAPAPEPAPAPPPKEETIVVHDLHFAFDSAKIDSRDKDKLDAVASKAESRAG